LKQKVQEIMIKIRYLTAAGAAVFLLAGCQAKPTGDRPVNVTIEQPNPQPGSVSIGPAEPTYPFESGVNEGKAFRRGGE